MAQTTIAQKIVVPAYFFPGLTSPHDYWEQTADSAPEVEIAIANVINGPDYVSKPSYTAALNATASAGVEIFGYVDTGYMGTTGQKTRLGATGEEAWRAQIIADIDAWYEFYGTNIKGIFFDQATNSCGTGNANANFYAQLTSYVKNNHAGSRTILNPGIVMPECYENSGDILVMFEGEYKCYIGASTCTPGLEFHTPTWGTASGTNPRKFYHLVYNTAEADVANALALSKSRNAGYIYITDDNDSNPWNTLPPGTYWTAERSGVAAGGTVDTTAPSAPASLDTVSESYYDAVLDWTPSTDAGSGVASYDLHGNSGAYLGSVPALPLVGGYKQAIVDTLKPGVNYSITAKGRDRAGNVSAASDPVAFQAEIASGAIPTAPSSLAVSNVGYTNATLSWGASTVSGATIVSYDVFKGSTKVMTVPGNILSTYALGLTPNTSSSYTVKANTSTGRTSSASSAATVNTLSLPSGASVIPAAVGTGGNDYESTQITYKADFYYPYSFKRVFIDADSSSSTGYLVGGIGADYAIEGSRFMVYAGTGTNYNWTVDANLLTPTDSGYAATWVAPLSRFTGILTDEQKVVFQADGFGPYYSSAATTLTKH